MDDVSDAQITLTELGHEALIDGIIRPVPATYVLQPCGHFLTKGLL